MEPEEEKSFQELGFELLSAINEAKTTQVKRRLIQEFIANSYQFDLETVTSFPGPSEWFNCSRALSVAEDLSGKLVVLDFFTYCCINCMHILPDLHALEQKHSVEDGLVVVGVHSAKFDNEKLSANILSAVLRYDITHPVINDQRTVMWEQFNIACWPTLVVVSPDQRVLLHLVGEGHRDALLEFVDVALEYYEALGQIKHTSLACLTLSRDSLLHATPLMFPGKLAVSPQGKRLAISDSGHHRVLVTDLSGVILETIGSGASGHSDGEFQTAQFHAPQGVCWLDEDTLFVADTGNHIIRKVAVCGERRVSTVAGEAGVQGHDMEGGKLGTQQLISSPWDLTLGSSLGSCELDVMFIAMAGTHQIWMYFLKDGKWLKGKSYAENTCVRFAGSGSEENRNNSYPHKAAFAQPSGICRGRMKPGDEHDHLFIADAESSSVRSVSFKDGAVKNVAGGERNPSDLFAFGDVDGKGVAAKFQHPLAVSITQTAEGSELYVADSYNHKVKVIDLPGQESRTLFGTGKAGSDLQELNEPGGLDVHGKSLYIADTNNHAIKVYKLETKTLSELPILFEKTSTVEEIDITDSGSSDFSPAKRVTPKSALVLPQQPLRVPRGEECGVEVCIRLDQGLHLTEGAPSCCQIRAEDFPSSTLLTNIKQRKVKLESASQPVHFTLTIPDTSPGSHSEKSSKRPKLQEEGDMELNTQEEVKKEKEEEELNTEEEEEEHNKEEQKDEGNMEFNTTEEEEYMLEIECMVYYCDDVGVCMMKGIRFELPIQAGERKGEERNEIVLNYTFGRN